MVLQQKTTVIDLNGLLSCGDILLSPIRRDIVNGQSTNSFFADTRLYTKAPIQSLCRSIQWKSSGQIFLMLRSVFDNGIRSTDIQRKPPRYRNLFKGFGRKTLSLWFPRKSLKEQFSQYKRKTRLANLSRLRTSSDQKCQATLCRRRLWYYLEKYSLCFGRNSDRSMFVTVSLGSASQAQKCGKAPYANGPQRLYTHLYTHYKRCCTRNNRLSNTALGTISHIRHGQRLHRFCNIIQFFKEQLLLHYSGKKQCSLLPQMFSPNRQKHRSAKRSDNKNDRPKNFAALSDTAETDHLSRRRTATYFRLSDQQFSTRRIDCLPALQTALADRTILQMDQAAPANKIFFWHLDQRCQDPNLDSDKCLCACSDNQKRIEAGAFTTRNTPNSQHPSFRENTAKSSTYGKLLYF